VNAPCHQRGVGNGLSKATMKILIAIPCPIVMVITKSLVSQLRFDERKGRQRVRGVNSQQYVALDAPTGEQGWIHQRSGVCRWPGCPRHADGQLLLLEGKTGKAIWD
jgi:outer membrane protein assembly factor BamB